MTKSGGGRTSMSPKVRSVTHDKVSQEQAIDTVLGDGQLAVGLGFTLSSKPHTRGRPTLRDPLYTLPTDTSSS